jgi:hypothetical protein
VQPSEAATIAEPYIGISREFIHDPTGYADLSHLHALTAPQQQAV